MGEMSESMSGPSVINRLKILVPLALAAVFALIFFRHIATPESTVNSAAHNLTGSSKQSDKPTAISPQFGLFTSAQICKAIGNAVLGTVSADINVVRQENKNVVSFKRNADAQKSSYECEYIGDRFYWESTSKLVSSSIIEVEPRISVSRTDELTLYIFDTSDTGNIVKTFNIEQL